MKKLIALTLSLLMVFALVPMTFVSADTSTGRAGVSRLIVDFDNNQPKSFSSDGDDPAATVTSSTLSTSFDAWKEICGDTTFRFSGKGQPTRIVLPDGWTDAYTAENGKTYSRPNAISMNMCSSQTIGPNTTPTLAGQKLTLVAGAKISANTVGTVTYKIPTNIDLTANSTFAFTAWATNQTIYLDNIKLEYYDGFEATFKGTETAVLSSEVDSIFQDNTAGQTKITLPGATLDGDKTLAGWVTEADSATVLPAGTVVSLEDDTAYYAVATDRGPYPTPDAPTVSAKTFNSVTLTALGSDYVYSKDGETWQESNEFTSLEPSTEYTFYTKHIATLAYDESAVSAGTTVTTDIITEFVFSSTYVTLSDNTAGVSFQKNDGYPNISKTGLSAGVGVTVTTNYTVAPGVYDATLYARSYAGRAPVNVEINGTKVAESLDTSSSSGTTGTNKPFALGSLTIPETTVLTIKFTTTGSGSLYLNSLKLDKTADYVATQTTDAISTKDTASIRLSDTINGIRFYTTVDEEKLNTLVNGQTYEIGTLIGPKDLIGDELTIDDFTNGNALNVEYRYKVDEKISYHEETDFKGIVGSIVGIKESNTFNATYGNINREFVARGYVKVGDTYYYSSTTATRSLGYIASQYVADSSNPVNENANRWAAAYNAVNPSAE